MFLFIGKAIILYFLAIGIIRLMGKSAFAQVTAHDLIGIFFVITLAMGPLANDKFIYAVCGLITISILHIILSRLALVNTLNRLFIGKPMYIIKHGKLIRKNLKRAHFTLAAVLSILREKGYPDITAIEYAFIEPSGEISVIPKPQAAPVTPAQLGIEAESSGIPVAVIVEGKIQHRNLQYINKDAAWLEKELETSGHPDLDTIFYAAVYDHAGHLQTIDSGEGEQRTD
jgi:uncharacterized membrane protein YcaP (DUF421 family)